MTTADYRRAAEVMHAHRRAFQKHPAVEFDIGFHLEDYYKRMSSAIHTLVRNGARSTVVWTNAKA